MLSSLHSHGNLDQIIFGSSLETRLFCDYMIVYVSCVHTLGMFTVFSYLAPDLGHT